MPKTEDATIGWITQRVDTGEPVSFNKLLLINGSLPKARRILLQVARAMSEEGNPVHHEYRSFRVRYGSVTSKLYDGALYAMDRGAFCRFQRHLRKDKRLCHLHKMPGEKLSYNDVITMVWKHS